MGFKLLYEGKNTIESVIQMLLAAAEDIFYKISDIKFCLHCFIHNAIECMIASIFLGCQQLGTFNLIVFFLDLSYHNSYFIFEFGFLKRILFILHLKFEKQNF